MISNHTETSSCSTLLEVYIQAMWGRCGAMGGHDLGHQGA